MNEAIIERIEKLMVTRLGLDEDEVSRELTFEEMELDSLWLVELGLVVQEEFGVKVGDDEVSPKFTLAEVSDLLEKKGVTL